MDKAQDIATMFWLFIAIVGFAIIGDVLLIIRDILHIKRHKKSRQKAKK